MKKPIHLNAAKVLKNYHNKLDSMQEHSKKKFGAYLYVIFSLITLSFFGIFAIRPTLSTISSLNQQYRDSQLIHQQLLEKSEALKNLDIQYQQLTPDLPLVYAAVPRSTLMASLTRQVESMANSNNLTLNALTFGSVELYPANKENPSLYSYTFNASAEGEEENVKNFIGDLIRFERLVNIEQMNTGNRENGSYGVTVTGKVYFSKN